MSTEDPFQALVPGEEDHFATVDYIIFAFMLMVSAGIGIFYAFQGVHKSHQEFVMGGRSMHCAPVALSLTASFMSAVTVLGTPAEVYRFGMKFAFFSVSYFVMVAITAHVFLPVYYRLRVTSAYEVRAAAVFSPPRRGLTGISARPTPPSSRLPTAV